MAGVVEYLNSNIFMAKEVSDDKHIYVVGSRRLQNELMTTFLEQETGIKCKVLNDLRGIAIEKNKDAVGQRLILWDCSGKDLKTFLSDLESYGEDRFSQNLVVLFNVVKGLGIEEAAVDWGIKGVFYEKDPMENYPKGIRAVFSGELWFSRKIMTKQILKIKRRNHIYRKDAAALTRREVEVLSMVAIGRTNEEIADKLYISSNTVKTHMYNIFRKIDVPNRLQAALWAAKNL